MLASIARPNGPVRKRLAHTALNYFPYRIMAFLETSGGPAKYLHHYSVFYNSFDRTQVGMHGGFVEEQNQVPRTSTVGDN